MTDRYVENSDNLTTRTETRKIRDNYEKYENISAFTFFIESLEIKDSRY